MASTVWCMVRAESEAFLFFIDKVGPMPSLTRQSVPCHCTLTPQDGLSLLVRSRNILYAF